MHRVKHLFLFANIFLLLLLEFIMPSLYASKKYLLIYNYRIKIFKILLSKRKKQQQMHRKYCKQSEMKEKI